MYDCIYLGGLGITQFSATVQQTKLRMLMAGLAEDGGKKNTAKIYLSRVGRLSGVDFSKGWQNYIDTLPENEHRCWAVSLVEQLSPDSS